MRNKREALSTQMPLAGALERDRKRKLLGRLSPKILKILQSSNAFCQWIGQRQAGIGSGNFLSSHWMSSYHKACPPKPNVWDTRGKKHINLHGPGFKECWFEQGLPMWSKGRFGFSCSLCRISLPDLFTPPSLPPCCCCSWLSCLFSSLPLASLPLLPLFLFSSCLSSYLPLPHLRKFNLLSVGIKPPQLQLQDMSLWYHHLTNPMWGTSGLQNTKWFLTFTIWYQGELYSFTCLANKRGRW